MRVSSSFATLALAASAFAWKIPQGTTDGVYKVETLADGSTVHTKIIDAADIDRNQPLVPGVSLAPINALSKRFHDQVWCGCGYNMVPGDCDAAVADLKTQLRPSIINPGLAYYSIRGRVVAFVCNRGSGNWLVFPQNLADSLATITNRCGWYIAGARQQGNDDQALLYGYQRWNGNVGTGSADHPGKVIAVPARNKPVNHRPYATTAASMSSRETSPTTDPSSPFDDKTHIPCNISAVNEGRHSSCCVVGDLCLTNGMCKNPLDPPDNNWFWRNGCTDSTWSDPACPRLCENVEPQKNSSLIFNCLKTKSWCCGYRGGTIAEWPEQSQLNTTCCGIEDLAFTADDPIVFATATWSNQLYSTTSTIRTSLHSTILISTTTSPSSEPNPTTTESSTRPSVSMNDAPLTTQSGTEAGISGDRPSNATRIGLGVGIPIGALLVLGLGFFLWRRRRTSQQHYMSADPVEMADTKNAHRMRPTEGAVELSGHNVVELPASNKP
ncbi:hypothetical protein OPT61_g856 [Boeremia exigua]|uniref:Uncharacterized protein n=1 Tax=Boeremia exigua TaxID=749465 RepID=A0ACC2ISA3_9PLEO|nr:hypothetical protein OPT61_g856 [Boeremia exigua]